jgi:hypothetical protein
MGLTRDRLRGVTSWYYTCDACGLPILGDVHVDPPEEEWDYERYTHIVCPDDDAPAASAQVTKPSPHDPSA